MVAAAIPGSWTRMGAWQKNQINTTGLPTSPCSQIPSEISLNWRGTRHDEWLLSHPPGNISFALFSLWKKTWCLGSAPSCSRPSVPARELGGFLALISDVV